MVLPACRGGRFGLQAPCGGIQPFFEETAVEKTTSRAAFRRLGLPFPCFAWVAFALLCGVVWQDAAGLGVEITPRPWYRHYDRYSYGGSGYSYDRPSKYDPYYNLRVGPVGLVLGGTARMAVRWSDNNNRGSDGNTEAGYSMIPQLTLALNYPVNPYITLDYGFSVGYRYYPDGDAGESDFFLSGDAGVAATQFGSTIVLGDDHFIQIHDRLTFESETLSAETYYADNDTTMDYDTWRNTLDFTYNRRLHPDWRTGLMYAYEIRWASTEEYDYLDFDKHSVDWTLWWHVVRNIEVGSYLSWGRYDFDTGDRNNRDIYEAGMSASVSDALGIGGLSVSMNGGYEILNLDSENGSDDDDGGFTANFTTRYQPKAFPGHRVRTSFRRNHEDPDPSVNYADELLLGYGIDIRATRELIFTADIDWLDVNESDNGEHFNMWRFWVGGTYLLTLRTSCDLSYWFTRKEGTNASDYDMNTIEFGVTHRF